MLKPFKINGMAPLKQLSQLFYCLILIGFSIPVQAESLQQVFFRVVHEESMPERASSALQVAVSDYRLSNGALVSLVSAVHIGDKEYYQKLNELFRSYDIVLYELVGPPGATPVPGAQRGGLVNVLQEGFARFLFASLQLDEIDYSLPNFVHADVSLEDFQREAKSRGENFSVLLGKVMLNLLLASTVQQMDSVTFSAPEVIALYLDVSARRLFFAESLVHYTKTFSSTSLSPIEYYLLDFRNARVLRVLRDVLRSQPRPERIAIFYGAAHMADIERRLLHEFGGRLVETRWITAWQL